MQFLSFRLTEENRDWLIRLRRAFHEFRWPRNAPRYWMRDERWGLLSTIGSASATSISPNTRAPCANRLSDFADRYVRLHAGIHTIRSAPYAPDSRQIRTVSTTIYTQCPNSPVAVTN